MNKELAIECIKTQRQFVDNLTREAFDVAISLLDSKPGRWTVKEGETAFWDVCSECGEKVLH